MKRTGFLTVLGGAAVAVPLITQKTEAQTVTVADAQTKTQAKTYQLAGTLLEACSCRTLCRCWIGEDPDGGACHAFNAYHIDKGQINGIDVSGLTYVQAVNIPRQCARAEELDARHLDGFKSDAGAAASTARCLPRQARRSARGS